MEGEKKKTWLTEEHIAALERDGVCVVRGVITAEEAARVESGYWDWLEQLGSGIRRDDPSTWTLAHWPPAPSGIQKYFENAHAPPQWDMRTHPHPAQVFRELYGLLWERVVFSLDGFCTKLPRRDDADADAAAARDNDEASAKRVRARRWHIDLGRGGKHHKRPKSKRFPEVECFQSFVNITPAMREGDGGFCFLRGSHRHHAEFGARFGMTPADCHVIGKDGTDVEEQYAFYVDEKKCAPVALEELEAGDMVIWDSRTVHCNKHGRERVRMCSYLCAVPSSWRKNNKQQTKKWKEYFETRRNTQHWPHRACVVSRTWRTYGKAPFPYKVPPCKVFDTKEKRDAVRRALGIDDLDFRRYHSFLPSTIQ